MSKLREAAQQALEFCEFLWRDVPLNDYSEDMRQDVEAALRAALAEPVQEPTIDGYPLWSGLPQPSEQGENK